jgi:hypothetical protein
MMTTTPTDSRYVRPGWFTRHLANPAARQLARWGKAPKGLRELRVPRRTSGGWQTTPVNLLVLDGRRYLVAPRGATQWVRNIRAGGTAELRLGRQVEPIAVTELDDPDKPEILRAYLREWKAEVKVFFDGIDEDSSDRELAAIAPGFPVFEVQPA